MQGEGNERVGQTRWAPRPTTHHELLSHLRVKMRHELNTAASQGSWNHGHRKDYVVTFSDKNLLLRQLGGCGNFLVPHFPRALGDLLSYI